MEHRNVLDAMKDVIVSIKSINMDLEDNKHKSIFNDPQKSSAIAKLKSRMSATTNNLMIASKNHALNKGLSPVSLLDAAAFHLTATVVELVKLVKLQPPTITDSLEELNNNFDDIKKPSINPSLTQTDLDVSEDKTLEILSKNTDIPDICSTNTDTSKMPKTSVLKAVIDSDFDNNLDDFKV